MLADRASPGVVAPKLVIMPTERDRLLPALHAGHAEIAIGGFTVTEAHSQAVAFSHPTLADVHHVVVAGRDEPPIASLDDLSGREVHVRRFERLLRGPDEAERAPPPGPARAGDDRGRRRGPRGRGHPPDGRRRHRPHHDHQHPVRVLLAAGVRPAARLRRARRSAATAPSPGPSGAKPGSCSASINAFVDSHRVGTVFGNLLIKRYLGSAARLHNPGAAEDLRRFRATAGIFQKYGRTVPVRLAGHRGSGLSGVAHRPDAPGPGRSDRGHADHAGDRRRRGVPGRHGRRRQRARGREVPPVRRRPLLRGRAGGPR